MTTAETVKQNIVPGWWRKYTVWLAGIAVIIPDVLQWVLDNWALLDMIGVMDDGHKNILRTVIVALIPLAAAIKQKSIPPKDVNE